MLAQTAKQVVGVDIDAETIAWADGKYLRENPRPAIVEIEAERLIVKHA